jgi:hypothetical protein
MTDLRRRPGETDAAWWHRLASLCRECMNEEGRRRDPEALAERIATTEGHAHSPAPLDPADVPEVVHLAGTALTMHGTHVRQRCAWCGYVLIDQDLTRVAVAVEPGQEPGPYPTWEAGAFVAVFDTGGFAGYRIIEVESPEDSRVPDGSCMLLPPEMTLMPAPSPEEMDP